MIFAVYCQLRWTLYCDLADSQTVWISDGLHSLYVMVIPGSDVTEKEDDGSNIEGETIQNSGLHDYLLSLGVGMIFWLLLLQMMHLLPHIFLPSLFGNYVDRHSISRAFIYCNG